MASEIVIIWNYRVIWRISEKGGWSEARTVGCSRQMTPRACFYQRLGMSANTGTAEGLAPIAGLLRNKVCSFSTKVVVMKN